MFKILFGQLVDRILENKSLHEREAPPLALPVKKGPLRAKLKFRENTVLDAADFARRENRFFIRLKVAEHRFAGGQR